MKILTNEIFEKIVKTILFIIGIIAIGYILLLKPQLNINSNIFEVFFSIFGVIYAIIGGFIIVVLLEKYNAINGYIWKEVNALEDLRDYLIYVDNQNGTVAEINNKIKKYVIKILDIEIPSMNKYGKIDMDTSKEIYEIMKVINKIKITNRSDAVALGKLIDTMGEITTYRTNRLHSSHESLPFLLNVFLVFSSLLVVIIFGLIPIGDIFLEILLKGSVVFAIIFIYLVIWDLDHPFKGTWRISDKPYRDLLKRL